MKKNNAIRFSILIMVLTFSVNAFSQTTEFVYQGQLQNSSAPANGSFDFEFLLFDQLAGGVQQGATLTRSGVGVTNGTFSVKLDFGASFPGASRFLEIHVKPTGGGAFTPLTPRQAVSSTPYAVTSLNANIALSAITASNATQLGGVAANQYVVTTDPRMTDSRSPTAGSGNYIQNQSASPQASTNFNISGIGNANILNATTQFNISGNRILSNAGISNLFAGVGAGSANTTGSSNSFFGPSAGSANTTGFRNSFFGSSAGSANTTGQNNSFFGDSAGSGSTTGFGNSFFGTSAGLANTQGGQNSLFGNFAGGANTTGGFNSFFGVSAGGSNTTGANNTSIGRQADVGSGNLSNATALGANALVTQSNSLVLGSINTINGATADTNVGIGTTAPSYRLNVVGSSGAGAAQGAAEFANNANDTGVRIKNTATNGRTWSLFSSGGTTGLCQGCFTIYDTFAGQARLILDTSGNVGIGTTSPQKALSITGGLVVDQGNQNTTANGFGITFGSFSGEGISSNRGAGANQFGLDFFAGGGSTPRMSITNGGSVGIGTTNPTNAKLEVVASGGRGVYGSSDIDNGVTGSSSSGNGVSGQSTGTGAGVVGANNSSGVGAGGSSNSGIGVSAFSNSGVGLRAQSGSGNIVEGYGSNGLRKFHIDNNGTYTAGSDFAEALPASGNRAAYEPGDVLVVSTKTPGRVEKTSRPYDTRVAGIYSTRPGMLGAEKNGTSRVDADDVPVAIVGIVPTKVSAMNGSIKVGDLLTTSSTPGYAMRCSSRMKCVGAVVGKALEPLEGNKGVIKVLVMLR